MAARAVQISLDEPLLRRIDADPQARKIGRSAFIRSAVLVYLEAKRRRSTDEAIRRAYSGKADDLLADVEELMGAQAWPKK
jgi:metal-responsive CopG/Arc/MetJ family transcriptional regulator